LFFSHRKKARWVKILSESHPTLAFHASITNPFGKGSLIQLLRQFSALHPDKKQISVGFIGYPNVGKSSVINTLRKKKVCNVAPIPGETKVAFLSSSSFLLFFYRLLLLAKFESDWFVSSLGVAIHHFDEEDLPHRLPRNRAPQPQ
jgi:hypothetical protein